MIAPVTEPLSARARAILDAAEAPPGDVARLLRLADETIRLAAAAHRRGEELAAALHDVTARLEAAVQALAAAAAPAPPESDTAAVRLLAIEQAVAGATRGEVERRLRDEAGIADPQAILDDLFGAGTGPGARLQWGVSDAPAA